ncbi:MAG TPA: efflux RND transporter periplasmic adaptor subunit [Gemmataceae bacterium]|jgi:cobalt-zinc-cadmium efflux system membrane fusion protein|nr:efflux RND transporter periplasmic adaptor subunit [Gemmataceae bacterium]
MDEAKTANSAAEQSGKPGQAAGPAGPRAAIAWLARVVPTLLVLGALGGLAYWGHRTGWTVPKFTALIGTAPAGEKDWCKEHNVPESQCVECNPDLMPRGKEPPYCKVHGVPECPLDYPEVAQVQGRPELPRYDVRAALALRERPEASRRCKLHLRRIQFASAATVAKAGIDVDVAQEQPMEESVTGHGEVTYDPTRVAHVSAPVAGRACRVDRRVGDPVVQGDVLALIDAAEVGRAKAQLLQAVARLGLKSQTYESLHQAAGAVPAAQLREAEAALQEARIRFQAARQALINLGLPVSAEEVQGLSADQLAAHVQFLGLRKALPKGLDPNATSANLLPVKAPLDGVVVACQVAAGEGVEASKTLFVVADPSRMWLTLSVRLEDARHLAPRQPLRFRPDGGDEVAGTVGWIGTAVDEKTRTVKVWADLDNRNGRLRANTFGPGRIILRAEQNAVVVPSEAVQWDGDCYVVFVRDKSYLAPNAPKVFHVRKVRPGAGDERYTEILAGLLPGEVVVSKGSDVLRAELLKAGLGEG